jgi:hypothetical protein
VGAIPFAPIVFWHQTGSVLAGHVITWPVPSRRPILIQDVGSNCVDQQEALQHLFAWFQVRGARPQDLVAAAPRAVANDEPPLLRRAG